MAKMDHLRSKTAQFLSKYILWYSGGAAFLFLVGGIVSLFLFPNEGIASFVMIMVSGFLNQITEFGNNLISAENERKEKERDEEQNRLIDGLDGEE